MDEALARARYVRLILDFARASIGFGVRQAAVSATLYNGWNGATAVDSELVPPSLLSSDTATLSTWIDARTAPMTSAGTRDRLSSIWALTWPANVDARTAGVGVFIKFRNEQTLLARTDVTYPDVPPPTTVVTPHSLDDLVRFIMEPGPDVDYGGHEWDVVTAAHRGVPSPLRALSMLYHPVAVPDGTVLRDVTVPRYPQWKAAHAVFMDGDPEQAIRLFTELVETGDPIWRTRAALDRARVIVTVRPDEMEAAFALAVACGRADYDIPWTRRALLELGCRRVDQGQLEAAHDAFTAAVDSIIVPAAASVREQYRAAFASDVTNAAHGGPDGHAPNVEPAVSLAIAVFDARYPASPDVGL